MDQLDRLSRFVERLPLNAALWILFPIVYRVLRRVSLWAVWIGGLALLLSAFMITVEVVGRKIGGNSFDILGLVITLPAFRVPGSDEYSGYVFAGATTWAYSYCLLHRSHIRIDALYNQLPRLVRAMLDVVGLAALLFFMGYFTLQALGVVQETWINDSVSNTTQRTPLLLPQIAWLTGLVFFVITLSFLFAYALITLILGDTARVQAMAGTMSVEEEMTEETRGIQEMKR